MHARADSPTSLHVSWNHPEDGGSAVRSFQLNFRREGSGGALEWEERTVERGREREFILRGLTCGAEYALYLIAANRVGDSAPSSTVRARTEGGPPRAPVRTDQFANSNMSAVHLQLSRWDANECEITGFAVEYREKTQEEWISGWLKICKTTNFIFLFDDYRYKILCMLETVKLKEKIAKMMDWNAFF
jgi:Fibronectin type III domain